jgi:hypothetical protein
MGLAFFFFWVPSFDQLGGRNPEEKAAHQPWCAFQNRPRSAWRLTPGPDKIQLVGYFAAITS